MFCLRYMYLIKQLAMTRLAKHHAKMSNLGFKPKVYRSLSKNGNHLVKWIIVFKQKYHLMTNVYVPLSVYILADSRMFHQHPFAHPIPQNTQWETTYFHNGCLDTVPDKCMTLQHYMCLHSCKMLNWLHNLL